MFKTLKIAVIGTALLLAGAVHAASVPAGTLSMQPFFFSPGVNTGTNSVTLGGSIGYFSGTGAFSPISVVGNSSSSPFSFDPTQGNILGYTGTGLDLAVINGLFTFSDGSGETYSFNLDNSIQTVTNTITGQGQSIGLYLLGDMTGTGTTLYDATPTAVTLTLNKTGNSAWSFSATLSNPPPGSGVTTNVPEPASMTLLGGGLAVLGFVRRRKRQA